MATQSAVLGYNFGIGYEMGKRTIKALDNDFFNKIVSNSTDKITVVVEPAHEKDGKLIPAIEIKMQYNQYISFITKRHGQEQIDTFRKMIPDFMSLQDTIIEKSVDIEMAKATRTPSAVVEIWQAYKKGIREVGKDARFNFDKLITALFGGIFTPGDTDPDAGSRGGGDTDPHTDNKEDTSDVPAPIPDLPERIANLPDRTAKTMTQTMAVTDLGRTDIPIRQRVKYITYRDKSSSWWSTYLKALDVVMAQLVQWQKGNAEYGRLNNLIAYKFSSAGYNYRQIFGKNWE